MSKENPTWTERRLHKIDPVASLMALTMVTPLIGTIAGLALTGYEPTLKNKTGAEIEETLRPGPGVPIHNDNCHVTGNSRSEIK